MMQDAVLEAGFLLMLFWSVCVVSSFK